MNNVLNNYLLICVSASGFSICIFVYVVWITICLLCVLGIKKYFKNEGNADVEAVMDDEADADENDYIRKYIDSYLKRDKPGFAVFINGPWGSGKTFFINSYKTQIKQKIYVSLFGIANKGEFEFRLWKGIIFDNLNYFCVRLKIWIKKLVCNFIYKWIIFITLTICIISVCWWSASDENQVLMILRAKYIFSIIYSFFKLFIALFGALSVAATITIFVWKITRFKVMEMLLKNCFIVFDDFERIEIPCNEVLSWINEFVEHVNCPVIILGNENAVIENIELKCDKEKINDEKIHYKKIKEKTIGKEFKFKQKDEKVCRILINYLDSSSNLRRTLENNMEWFISTVLDPLKKMPYKHQTNYRVLNQCFSDFEYYFNKNPIYAMEDWTKFVASEHWKDLIVHFISFTYLKKIGVIPIVK